MADGFGQYMRNVNRKKNKTAADIQGFVRKVKKKRDEAIQGIQQRMGTAKKLLGGK